MKKAILSFAIIAIVIFAYISGRHHSADKRPNTAQEQQAQWSNGEYLPIADHAAMQRLISTKLSLYTNGLNEAQITGLKSRIEEWLQTYSNIDFAAYLRFRKPQRLNFESDFFNHTFERLRDKGIEIPEADEDKLKLVYQRQNRNAFEAVLAKEFRVKIYRWSQVPPDKEFYSDMYSFSRSGFTSLHSIAAVKNVPSPAEVLNSAGTIQIAIVSAAIRCKDRPAQAVPVVLAFYWVESEAEWRPEWFFLGTVPLLSKDDIGVHLYF